MKIIKIIKFNERLTKILQISEFHIRNTKIIEILKLDAKRVMKIKNKKRISCENYEP